MPAGVLVENVAAGMPAERSGLRPGDRLLEVNGRKVDDHLDVRFHAADCDVIVDVRRGKERIALRIEGEDDPFRGVVFEEIRPRVCASKCVFCFIDQLPAEVRPSLKVKDEDFRLSFLHGNYMTLGNLKDRDLARILEQRLSPLYVSIHAVDEKVRAVLLGRPPRRPLLPTMEALLEGGIELYGQIVLCPGLNDGAVLDETMTVLSSYHPGLRGVAVVPLGLSSHREKDDLLSPVTPAVAADVIDSIERKQDVFRARLGTRFVFPGDEFYLLAGRDLPPAAFYEEYDQVEDGVGMVRRFRERFDDAVAERSGRPPAVDRLALVTGTLFAGTLESCLGKVSALNDIDLKVVPVKNRFLGSTITVAGLLGGRDVATALREEAPGYPAVIPAEMVSRANGLLLDDYTPHRLLEESGAAELFIADGGEGLARRIWDGDGRDEPAGTYPHR